MDLLNVPQRYIPKILSTRDTKKQKQYLKKSRKLYKKGIYYQRPKVKSFKSKPSQHVKNAEKIYKIDKISPSAELAEKTQCSQEALEKIVNKGRGAYYSSGSRPNQTAESWGIARLASAISGGNASIIDYHILHDGCKPTSKALKMANRTCKKQNKCQKYFMNKTRKETKKRNNFGEKWKKGGSGKSKTPKRKPILTIPSKHSAFSPFTSISNKDKDIETGIESKKNSMPPVVSLHYLDLVDLESGSKTPLPHVFSMQQNDIPLNLTPSSQLSRNTSTPVFQKVDSSMFIPGQQKIEEIEVNSEEDEEEPEEITYEQKFYNDYIMNYPRNPDIPPPLKYDEYIKKIMIPENGIRYVKYGIQLYTLPNTNIVYDKNGKIYTEEDIKILKERYDERPFTDPDELTLVDEKLGIYVNETDPSLSKNRYDKEGNLLDNEGYKKLVSAYAKKIKERIRKNYKKMGFTP